MNLHNVPDVRYAVNYFQEQGLTALFGAVLKSVSEDVFKQLFGLYVDINYHTMVINSEELTSTVAQRVYLLKDETNELSPDLNRQIAPLKNCDDVSHTYLPRFSFKQPFVAVVPDTVIVGRHAIAVAPDGRVFTEPTYSLAETSTDRVAQRILSSMGASPRSVGIPLIRGRQPRGDRTVSDVAILYTKWNNYYHWMIEQLPKIRGIKKYEEHAGTDVHLYIPSDPPTYVYESLDILGYGSEDYTEWDGTATNANRLITPSFPEPTPCTLRWLRETMIKSAPCSSPDNNGEIVYVSRQNTTRRSIQNFDEIKEVLEKYGVRVVECEKLSLPEEISLFSKAEGIIGPHGAGLTAMVWADHLSVVELFNSVVVPPYYVLAHVLGHDYTALRGIPVGPDSETREFHRDFEVSVDEFESVVSEMVSSCSD